MRTLKTMILLYYYYQSASAPATITHTLRAVVMINHNNIHLARVDRQHVSVRFHTFLFVYNSIFFFLPPGYSCRFCIILLLLWESFEAGSRTPRPYYEVVIHCRNSSNPSAVVRQKSIIIRRRVTSECGQKRWIIFIYDGPLEYNVSAANLYYTIRFFFFFFFTSVNRFTD